MSHTVDLVRPKLMEMVSRIDAAVIIVGASGMVEIANGQTARLLGREREQIENRGIERLFSGPAVAGLSAKVRQAIGDSSLPWEETFTSCTPDGKEIALFGKFSVVQPSDDHVSVLVLLSPIEEPQPSRNESRQSTTNEVRSMIASKSGTFTAGHLEMIGLDSVRTALGDRWDRLAERVYDVADGILKARLSREDVFRRDADGNYVICFEHLCNEQAWFKAKAIGREICETLIGKDADDALAEFKFDAGMRERISDVNTSTYEIEIEAEELAEVPDVMGLVKSKVAKAAENMRKRAAAMFAELAETGRIVLKRVKTLSGQPVPIRVASFDPESLMLVEQLRQVYCDSPKLLAQLDAMLLGNTLEQLFGMHPTKIPVTSVAVHFSTLVDRATSRNYFEIAGRAEGKPAKSLILKVCDIPKDLHHGRISETLRMLRNYSRLTAIHLSEPDLGNIDLVECRVSVVACFFDELKAMYRKDPEGTVRFFNRLRQYKVRVAVGGVSGVNGMEALTAIKPNFVSFALKPANPR